MSTRAGPPSSAGDTPDSDGAKAVHDLANVAGIISTSVTYLLENVVLDAEGRDAVNDLQLCVDRFPKLLERLRAGVGP
jgi:hypothetical protein